MNNWENDSKLDISKIKFQASKMEETRVTSKQKNICQAGNKCFEAFLLAKIGLD